MSKLTVAALKASPWTLVMHLKIRGGHSYQYRNVDWPDVYMGKQSEKKRLVRKVIYSGRTGAVEWNLLSDPTATDAARPRFDTVLEAFVAAYNAASERSGAERE